MRVEHVEHVLKTCELIETNDEYITNIYVKKNIEQ